MLKRRRSPHEFKTLFFPFPTLFEEVRTVGRTTTGDELLERYLMGIGKIVFK